MRNSKCACLPIGRDCGVEKADKIAFLANYTKPLEIIGPGGYGYMEIKSEHFWLSENREFIADIEPLQNGVLPLRMIVALVGIMTPPGYFSAPWPIHLPLVYS